MLGDESRFVGPRLDHPARRSLFRRVATSSKVWLFSIGFPASLSTAGIRRSQEGVAMGRLTWIAGLVLCAGLTDRQTASGSLLSTSQWMAPRCPMTLFNGRRMSPRASFTSQASPWSGLTPETCQAPCLTVRIVTQPVSAKSRNPHMLGVAPGTKEVRGINL